MCHTLAFFLLWWEFICSTRFCEILGDFVRFGPNLKIKSRNILEKLFYLFLQLFVKSHKISFSTQIPAITGEMVMYDTYKYVTSGPS